MTPEDLAALDELGKDAKSIFGHYPRISSRITWLCELVKRMNAPESVKDDRDAVLVQQADRILKLEQRLNLTPERVLALERAELRKKQEEIVEKAIAGREKSPKAKKESRSRKIARSKKSKTPLAT